LHVKPSDLQKLLNYMILPLSNLFRLVIEVQDLRIVFGLLRL
jgi:hypothetical protein